MQDKLDTSQFVVNGKNLRTASKVDLAAAGDHLKSLGYQIISLEQVWRNVTGILETNGQRCFFKMASTADLSASLANEIAWLENISGRLVGSEPFIFPKIVASGQFGQLSYYLSTDHQGQLLSETHQPVAGDLGDWLSKIIDCNLFLLRQAGVSVPKDAEFGDWEKKKQQLYKTWEQFLAPVKDFQLDEVYDQIKLYEQHYQPALSHGDFVPWHMINQGDKFVLIDPEHGSSKAPKYYDAVYFFHRVYTSGRSPELAKQYLIGLKSRLTAAEKGDFDNLIRPILATRVIGGFWDAKNYGATDYSMHIALRDEFLSGSYLK